ncbi:MAG: hypothetical protein JW855_00640 [Gammaproteobacteria bacterium]|nr:hypothetical protein [Gammaproteobacteria bacterium]
MTTTTKESNKLELLIATGLLTPEGKINWPQLPSMIKNFGLEMILNVMDKIECNFPELKEGIIQEETKTQNPPISGFGKRKGVNSGPASFNALKNPLEPNQPSTNKPRNQPKRTPFHQN